MCVHVYMCVCVHLYMYMWYMCICVYVYMCICVRCMRLHVTCDLRLRFSDWNWMSQLWNLPPMEASSDALAGAAGHTEGKVRILGQ